MCSPQARWRCSTTTAVSLVLFILPLYVLFMYFAVVLIPSYSDKSDGNKAGRGAGAGQFLIWVTPVLRATGGQRNGTLRSLRTLAGALNSGRLFAGRSKLWMVVEQGDSLTPALSQLLDTANALPSTHLAAEADGLPLATGAASVKGATLACWLRALQRLGEHFTQDIFAEYPMRGHVLLNARILSDMALSTAEEFRSTTLLAHLAGDGGPQSDVDVYLVPGSGALLATDALIARRHGARGSIVDVALREALSEVLDQTL